MKECKEERLTTVNVYWKNLSRYKYAQQVIRGLLFVCWMPAPEPNTDIQIL